MNYNSTAIKDILNLTDDDCEVTDFHIEGHTKYVTIEKNKAAQLLSYMWFKITF